MAEKLFVVFHSAGENWPSEGLSFDHPIVQDHGKYFGKLHSEGLVTSGGPFPGESGGMMIFRDGLERDEVESLAMEDPAYKEKFINFEIRAWLRVF